MKRAKVAVTPDESVLTRVDSLVQSRVFANRSQAIEVAIREKIERLDRTRLARECAKLSAAQEQAMADEGLAGDSAEGPEY